VEGTSSNRERGGESFVKHAGEGGKSRNTRRKKKKCSPASKKGPNYQKKEKKGEGTKLLRKGAREKGVGEEDLYAPLKEMPLVKRGVHRGSLRRKGSEPCDWGTAS